MTAIRARGESGIARGIGMGLLFGAISLVLMLVLTPIVGTVAPALASWVVLLIWIVMPILPAISQASGWEEHYLQAQWLPVS